MINLSAITVAFRAYKVGTFEPASLRAFQEQLISIKEFANLANSALGNGAPKIAVITNADLPAEGMMSLRNSKLDFVTVDPALAQRRSRLAARLLKKGSAKGLSNADMLNALGERNKKAGSVDSGYIFASSDLAAKPAHLLKQIIGMKAVWNFAEIQRHDQTTMVGSLIEGIHDLDLVRDSINGTTGLTLRNISRVFPNNALSLVGPNARFSGTTDNSLAGAINAGEDQYPIGGNEDFLYALLQMVYHNKTSVLLTDPYVPGERTGEVSSEVSKYKRRALMYNLYATRVITQAVQRKIPSFPGYGKPVTTEYLDVVFESLIDDYLFFAHLDSNGKAVIDLTARQKERRIEF